MSQRSNNGVPPELVQQLTARLRPVCPGIPEDEFACLVEDVARVKLKYDADEADSETARRTG
jgi:hypothetical protein